MVEQVAKHAEQWRASDPTTPEQHGLVVWERDCAVIRPVRNGSIFQ